MLKRSKLQRDCSVPLNVFKRSCLPPYKKADCCFLGVGDKGFFYTIYSKFFSSGIGVYLQLTLDNPKYLLRSEWVSTQGLPIISLRTKGSDGQTAEPLLLAYTKYGRRLRPEMRFTYIAQLCM